VARNLLECSSVSRSTIREDFCSLISNDWNAEKSSGELGRSTLIIAISIPLSITICNPLVVPDFWNCLCGNYREGFHGWRRDAFHEGASPGSVLCRWIGRLSTLRRPCEEDTTASTTPISGKIRRIGQTSPIHRLKAAPKPMLLVCSPRRPDNPCLQAQRFGAKVTSLGGRATVLPEKMTHAQINADLGLPGNYTEAVETFLRSLNLP
jgi:hypothetical protein